MAQVRRYKTPAPTRQIQPLTAIFGLVLIVAGLAAIATVPLGLWATTSNLDRLSGALEPVMVGDSPTRYRADIEQIGDSLDELVLGLPLAVSELEGITLDQAAAELIADYPDTANGIAELSGRGLTVGTVVSLLEAEQARYNEISRFPIPGFPARLLAGLALLAGLVMVGSGVAAVLGRSPLPGAVAALLVVVLVVVQSLPDRADDVGTFRTIFVQSVGPDAVEGGRSGIDRLESFYGDLVAVTLPGLADRLGIEVDSVEAAVGDRLPVSASVIGSLPRTRIRFEQLLDSVEQVEAIEEPDSVFDLATAIDVLFLASILGGVVGLAGEVARRRRW
jgi:hypothetical protein